MTADLNLPRPDERWCVLGGGLLGMTLASELAKTHADVTLIEASGHLGGLADAWQLGGITWDRHYHVILLSDRHLRELLGELDLERELRWVSAGTGFFGDGRLHSVSSALEYLRFPLLGFQDKLRLALTILYASRCRDHRKFEGVPVERWLTRWSGRRTFERLWRPLLQSKLGANYRNVSAAFIWAIIRRLYRARQQGLRQELFGYIPGGYARILAAFTSRLKQQGVSIELGRRAVRVASGPQARDVRVHFADGSSQAFDRIIVTAPAKVAAALCPDLTGDELSRLRGIEYQGIVCSALLLRKPLSRFYVTNIVDQGLPFTGIIEMTALVDPAEFGGHSLVYLPRYVAPDDPYFDLQDDEVRERCLAGLERMYPAFSRSDVIAFRVSRVRQVFALPTLDYSRRLPPVRTSLPGVYILNSAHITDGTLNVDETVQLARRYRELCQLTAQPDPLVPTPAIKTYAAAR